MREIKFRVRYADTWGYIELTKGLTRTGYEAYMDCVATGETFYQYTGLKDKNGKEIYEGDICTRTVKRSCCGSVDYAMRGVVEWLSEGFYLKDEDDLIYGWANQKNEEIEVIGNIYENPELLK